MPFALIPTALGVCFLLVWFFIGGMVFRDGQLAAQRDRDSGAMILPLSAHRVAGISAAGRALAKSQLGKPVVRVAS